MAMKELIEGLGVHFNIFVGVDLYKRNPEGGKQVENMTFDSDDMA
jgi:hypothetical protein